jgi:hypothetical protein
VLCVVCVLSLVSHVNEKYRLRAFNGSVIRKLNPNRDGVMERWMELHNLWFCLHHMMSV